MRKTVRLALALGALSLAACGGGGSGAPGASGALLPGPPTNNPPRVVSVAIKIPAAPSATGAARHATYVSPGTQSIGVVVTNQGAAPSLAQFVNVSSCPQVSGVTTCSVNVSALPGSDTFAITTYSAANGGGSALSVGSIASTIVSGVANTTLPLTLGGVVNSISIVPQLATLPLGQSEYVTVVAKDATGSAIVGTFDNALTLRGSNTNLLISPVSITNSNDASKVNVVWARGFGGSTGTTVTATVDGATGTQAIMPGTGFAYYTTGTNAANNSIGFKSIIGPDGNFYYTSLGPVVCGTTAPFVCSTPAAAIHQFNVTTNIDTEVDVPSEAVGLHFSTDGALWVGGGVPTATGPQYLYRMAPGAFSSASLAAIPVPAPSASPNISSIRSITEDAAGNMWFVNQSGHEYMKIPAGGPYQTSAITAYKFPKGIAGTRGAYGASRTIDFAGGVLIASDFANGEVDVINPATGAVTGQYLTNLQKTLTQGDFSNGYDSATDGSKIYLTNQGSTFLSVPQGDIEAFDPSTHAFTTLPAVAGPVSMQPLIPSVNGSFIDVVDFTLGGIDYSNPTTGSARFVPIVAQGANYFQSPGSLSVASDGTQWFACYASAAIFQPLCVGHSVYLSGWSVWPSSSISLYGAGPAGAQIMGIMEPASANSGPFTESSSNTAVCTVANASDHNFNIVGQSAGACTVTVTDSHSASVTVNVTVTTTSGTVQARRAAGDVK
jgi:hypothetical protein